MGLHYCFATSKGLFKIVQEQTGRWQAMFEDEGLGSYARPNQAAEDLAGGHTFMPSCGDTEPLGIPAELSDWQSVSSAR